MHALCARHAAAAAAGDAIPALADETERLLHKTMRKVTTDIEKLGFNTAISALMVLANELAGKGANPPVAPRDALERLVPSSPAALMSSSSSAIPCDQRPCGMSGTTCASLSGLLGCEHLQTLSCQCDGC